MANSPIPSVADVAKQLLSVGADPRGPDPDRLVGRVITCPICGRPGVKIIPTEIMESPQIAYHSVRKTIAASSLPADGELQYCEAPCPMGGQPITAMKAV